MPARLVALDDGPDINLDRAMVVVGRHPSCDTRLDSLRVSRHHCCMTQENGEVMVRDLGSTNGIRINGQRVEIGRIRPGDELSIAHIRYRLENGQGHEQTIAEAGGVAAAAPARSVDPERAPSVAARPLDPPSFGRGPNGETWKLEDNLFPLIKLTRDLLSDDPLFVIINSYTTGFQPAVLRYMADMVYASKFGGKTEAYELGLPVTESGLILPCGATARYLGGA